MICEILSEDIFDFCRMSIASYAIETKAKKHRMKAQGTQKKVSDNDCLTNSWNSWKFP